MADFPTLYAALLSQGCNFGFARMAQMADISADRLAWCTAWHLREDTPRCHHDLGQLSSWAAAHAALGRDVPPPMGNVSRWPARFAMPRPYRATFAIKG